MATGSKITRSFASYVEPKLVFFKIYRERAHPNVCYIVTNILNFRNLFFFSFPFTTLHSAMYG